jgi:hypothetical protein
VRSTAAKLRPQFAQPEATVQLSGGHSVPAGFVVHAANASVPATNDSQLGLQLSHPQQLQFALHSADDLAALEVFRVDSASGNVILERPLPQRLASPFTLTISATLSSSASSSLRAGFATLRMGRRPENEHAPMVGLGRGESD